MVAVEQPFAERITFVLAQPLRHLERQGAQRRRWMLAQNEKLRTLGRGDFRALALAMLTDAAMLDWLDGQQNTVRAPNENLSREFMELFALGHGDGYTEQDVREGARALTGWRIDRRRQHAAARRTARQRRQDGARRDRQPGRDGLLRRRSGARRGAALRRHPDVRPAGVRPSADRRGGAAGGRRLRAARGPSRACWRALLGSARLRRRRGHPVIGPVEWLVGACARCSVPMDEAATADAARSTCCAGWASCRSTRPTSAAGRPGAAWLSTAAADLRMTHGDIPDAQRRPGLRQQRRATAERVDAAGYLLGIGRGATGPPRCSSSFVGDPARLVAVALNSPEYLTY